MFKKFDNFADSINTNISGFLKRNLILILVPFLVGLYVNGFDIFNMSLSIDKEIFWTATTYGEWWLDLHRWGLYFFSIIIPMHSHPFISQIFGLFILTITALLFIDKYKNITFESKLLFCVLVTSFPVFSFMSVFSIQIAYFQMGGLCAIAAYRFFDIFLQEKKYLYALYSIVLLLIATGTYQNFLLLPLMFLAIDNFIKYINKQTTLTQIIKLNIYACIIIAIAYIGNFLVIKALDLKSNGYLDNFVRWDKSNVLIILGDSFVQVYRMIIGIRNNPPITIFATIAIFIAIPHIMKKQGDVSLKNFMKLFIIVFIFILSGSALALVIAQDVTTRNLTSVTFFFAGGILIYYLVATKIEKIFITLFAVFSVFYHGSIVTGYFASTYFSFENDKIVAERVLDRIYDEAPEFYVGKIPVAFIGHHDFGTPTLIKQNKDVFRGSFWNWDRGNPDRMLKFMQMIGGVPMDARLANLTEQAMAREFSKTMPSFPVKESVQLHNGVVIVKFMIPN